MSRTKHNLAYLRDLACSVSAEDGGVSAEELPIDFRESGLGWQDSFSAEELAAMAANVEIEEDFEGAFRCLAAEAHAKGLWAELRRVRAEAEKQMLATAEKVQDLAKLVMDSLRITLREARGGSWYGEKRGLKIRVSDHCQVRGGGWSEERQERMGEAELQFVVESTDSSLPTRAEIRQRFLSCLV